jgi:2-polyprenyl-3-methyl-5-hydroxy-6-metoxy-1,4-benzoquinol methylase
MKCLLCGSKKYKAFEQTHSFGFPLSYYQCARCGLVFQSLEDAQAADPDFYAEIYRKIYQGNPEPTAKDLYIQKNRSEFLIHFLQRQKVYPARILDVGASSGMLLSAFRQAFSAQTAGVEPGDAYRAHAEAQGLDMHPSLESLAAAGEGPYDLVSLIHVIEHLPDPVRTLMMIREELLTEGGYLLVEAPNFYAHDSYELAHLACFTAHTLGEALRQAGYRVIKLKRHGEPRSDLLKLYLTALAVPTQGKNKDIAPRLERLVGFKRSLGMLTRRLVQKLFPHKAWRPLPGSKAS